MREQPTFWEAVIWKGLTRWKRAAKFGVQFENQVIIRGYIVDFYCRKLMLAIELDGNIHSREGARERDAQRDQHLFNSGVTVMRFKNPTCKLDVRALFFTLWPELRFRLRLFERGISTFPPRSQFLKQKKEKKAKRKVGRRKICGNVEKGCQRQVFANEEVAQATANFLHWTSAPERCVTCGLIHLTHDSEG